MTLKFQVRYTKKKSDLELCIDAVYINGVEFLVSIEIQVKFRWSIPITSDNEEEFFKGLDKIFCNYNSVRFSKTITNADNDTYTNPGDHVTGIEKNNRAVKERYHAQYHRLPFQKSPKVVIRYLSFWSGHKIEFFYGQSRSVTIL